MIKATEEMGLEKEWYEEARLIKINELEEFVSKLMYLYNHDYGTVVKAMCAGMMATMSAMNKHETQGGITGFQASCLMWELIKQFNLSNYKCGAKLVDFDNMLYPQYEKDFEKVIDVRIWDNLKREASKRLNETKKHRSILVVNHLQSIVDGKVPFGYKVKKG